MLNMFTSKEVLKNLNNKNTRRPEGQHVVPVTGLYVTGILRSPHYIDRTLFISDIQSNEATIENFSETSVNVIPGSYTVTLTDLAESAPISFVRLSTNTERLIPGSYTVTMTNLQNDNPLTFTRYWTTKESAIPGSYTVTMTNLQNTQDLTFVRYEKKTMNKQYGVPMLTILDLSSQAATIENGS